MIRKQQITIKDIAKELNISTATVSRALRDTHDVSNATRESVLNKAKELNFRINLNARGLKSQKTSTIGVILPHINTYYFSTVFTGIQQAAFHQNYNVVLYVTGDSEEREMHILETLPLSSLDGLLVCVTGERNADEFKSLFENGMPIVFFDRVVDNINTSKVMQNDYASAYIATEHLINKGYDKIGCISGPPTDFLTKTRMHGYFEVLKKYKITVSPKWIHHSDFTRESGYSDINIIWKQKDKPNGIFAINDRKAVGAIFNLNDRKIVVGKEVGIVGITNDPISTIIRPSLSTVEEPAYDVGHKSCELLLKQIKKKNFIPEKIILSCKLIERDSTKRL